MYNLFHFLNLSTELILLSKTRRNLKSHTLDFAGDHIEYIKNNCIRKIIIRHFRKTNTMNFVRSVDTFVSTIITEIHLHLNIYTYCTE